MPLQFSHWSNSLKHRDLICIDPNLGKSRTRSGTDNRPPPSEAVRGGRTRKLNPKGCATRPPQLSKTQVSA
jgi:hypothetical protein